MDMIVVAFKRRVGSFVTMGVRVENVDSLTEYDVTVLYSDTYDGCNYPNPQRYHSLHNRAHGTALCVAKALEFAGHSVDLRLE